MARPNQTKYDASEVTMERAAALIIRTRHSTAEAARKRLSGVRQHTDHALYEHTTINGQPERVRLAWDGA